MTDTPANFDLTDSPWLPCRERDGTTTELGIRDALARAHELTGLSGDIPTQTFALTRLLLAVLHGALAGPRDVDEWEGLWQADKLPNDLIDAYLEKYRDRFDLVHSDSPFLQVADLHTSKGTTSELTSLIADVPNGHPVFTTRQGPNLTLSYAEAARWLVHCQAFDPSGIRSGVVGDDRAKNGKSYPIGVAWSGLLGGVLLEGTTLRETLLLNLIARDFGDYARDRFTDRPVWERPAATAAEEVLGGRPPTGPIDLYVWQSRRIRLIAESEKVARVLISNGDKLTPQNMWQHEPHTAWRRSEAQEKKPGVSGLVYMPREHDPERAIWRGLSSLLPGKSSRQGADGARYLSPGVVEWLSYLSNQGCLPRDHRVHLRAIGMTYGSNSSVIDDVVNDTIALRALLARQDATELAGFVSACVDSAEATARAVGGLAGDLVAAAGGDGSGARSREMERTYADLDRPFRTWLLEIRPSPDGTDPDTDPLRTSWHQTARGIAAQAARDLLSDISPACWEGRRVGPQTGFTAAHAEAKFWKALRAAVPAAFRTDTDEDEAA